MSIEEKDAYFVAVKVFLEKDDRLFIFKDRFGDWDLPGGRIKKNEFDTPLEDVVKRKIKEELGNNLKYALKDSVVFMRHQRTESVPGNPVVRIFAVGYQAELTDGEIETSSQHTETKWVDMDTFNPEEYFSGGWLKGVQEYLKKRKSVQKE